MFGSLLIGDLRIPGRRTVARWPELRSYFSYGLPTKTHFFDFGVPVWTGFGRKASMDGPSSGPKRNEPSAWTIWDVHARFTAKIGPNPNPKIGKHGSLKHLVGKP